MFVGREPESDELTRALLGSVPVVVTGPPGIGKSTLAQRTAVESVGSFVVSRGIATLDAMPFLLFRSRIDVAAESPEDAATQLVQQIDGALVVDDLQWADPASLEVVERLAHRLPLVATVRTGDERAEAVVDRLTAAGFTRIDLVGLPRTEAREVALSADPTLDGPRLDALLDTARGNPLLLTEMGRDGAHSPTLTAAMLDRLAGLEPPAREAMYRLSVLGRPAPADVLGSGADDLVRSGLAHRSDAGVEVHHALLGEVVLDQLGPEADEVRRRVAPLVSDYEAALLLSRSGDRREARSLALEAADASSSQRDRAEALVVAVANAPEGDLDVVQRVRLVELLLDVGRPAEALHHSMLDRLADHDLDPHDVGRLTGLAAYAHWMLGDTRRFAELIEEAIGHLRGSRTEAEVRVLAASTIYDTWVGLDGRSSLDRAREAVDLADRIGQAQAFARMRLAAVLSTSGADGWDDLYQEAIDLAERQGDARSANEAATSLVLAQWTRGDAHSARKVAARQLERTSRTDQPQAWLVHAASAAILDLLLGTEPEAIVRTWGPVLQESPYFRTRPFLEAAVTIALADSGADGAAQDAAVGITERAGRAEQWQAVAHWVLAETAWLSGRHHDLWQAVEHLNALGIGDYPPAVMARLLAAHDAVERGREPPGAEPLALMPAWRATPVEWRAISAEAACRHHEAVELFDEAARLYADHDERSRVRCLWAAGRTVQRAGGDAVERLVSAEDLADRHGYRALLRRIHPLLRRAGVARNAPTGRAPGGLTSREHEVLELVSRGRTSAQIASELGISRDTVDDLVRSALRRLGVSNRRAAVARLRSLTES